MRQLWKSFVWVAAAAAAGCAGSASNPSPTTRPALMSIPAEKGSPDYWFSQPAVASVKSSDFDRLFAASSATLVNDQFELDAPDYRLGLLTTEPMISKQFFEPWRSDAGDWHEVVQDSLQTIRRTVHIQFSRLPDGTFVAEPKVVKEQSSHPERRITTEAQFSEAFAATAETPTRTNVEGQEVPSRYWYAIGRDEAMERELANSIREKVDGDRGGSGKSGR